jgi:hypothetical protein
MARNEKEEKRPRSITLPVALDERLEAIAYERDTSVSHIAAKAILWYLDHMPPLPGEPETKAAKP